MNDMITESSEKELHDKHLIGVSLIVWQYNMRLSKNMYLWGQSHQIFGLLFNRNGNKSKLIQMQGNYQNWSTNNKERGNELKRDVDELKQI